MSYNEDNKRRKRIAIIGICSFLLVAMVVGVTVGVGLNKDNDGDDVNESSHHSTKQTSDSVKAIKSICQPTDYKATCEKTLQKHAGNTTDPMELIKVAFKVAQDYIKEAAKESVTLQELEKDPRTHGVLETCKQLMNMSVSELKQSIDKMSDFDITHLDEVITDLRTWLSATITYQETCLDAFENTTTNAGKKMQKALNISMQLSSNGLDIISGLSSLLSSLEISGGRRRLLNEELPILGHGDQFPKWVGFSTRRLLARPAAKIKPDIVVDTHGSGKYRTIQAALDNLPQNKTGPTVIYIKAGIYKEYLEITRKMDGLVLIGDGSDKTRITGNKNFIDGINTFRTSTVAVLGDNFIAKGIGFENSAGAIKHQAVALRVSGDYALFYNCSMDGYQDTLYTHAKRQFYRDCTISGTIDFVFGDAPVVFQNCKFLVRKPLDNQQNIVTAQGRKQKMQPTAIVLQNCTIAAHPELEPVKSNFKSYLGRPWKEFSRTVIMESFIDDVIHPDGWLPWNGTFGIKTCFYTEFGNRGPGSAIKSRVKWAGVKNITKQRANDFTPGVFLRSDAWIKKTAIPYTPGFTTKV